MNDFARNEQEDLVEAFIDHFFDKKEAETITYGYDKDNQRSVADRIILITETDGTKYEMPFPSKDVKDSEALHHLLSLVDPGETYTVSFSKKDFTPEYPRIPLNGMEN